MNAEPDVSKSLMLFSPVEYDSYDQSVYFHIESREAPGSYLWTSTSVVNGYPVKKSPGKDGETERIRIEKWP